MNRVVPGEREKEPDVAMDPVAEQDGAVSVLFGSCPIPIFEHKQIVLGHGSGGKLTSELIDRIFLPAFGNPVLDKLDDQAVVALSSRRSSFLVATSDGSR
jgi:hypothetical protein